MLKVIPKHKGTDHLQADIKSKLAKLKRSLEQNKTTGKRRDLYFIEPEGAGQIVMLGTPNTGKSSILSALTNANPAIASYPFTTSLTQCGMMPYDTIQIQLVDTPPITEHSKSMLAGLIRNADLLLLLINAASDDLLEDTELLFNELKNMKVIPVVNIIESENIEVGWVEQKSIIIITHWEHPNAKDNLELLLEYYPLNFPIHYISNTTGLGIEELKHILFEALEIIRVYTKSPGKEADYNDPIILKKDVCTLLDAAQFLHKDFAKQLKFACVWGSSKFDGQKVQKDYKLKDGDIVEFHI